MSCCRWSASRLASSSVAVWPHVRRMRWPTAMKWRRDPPKGLLRRDRVDRYQIEQTLLRRCRRGTINCRGRRRPSDHMKRPPIEEFQFSRRMTPLPRHSRAKPMTTQRLEELLRDLQRALSHRPLQQPRVPPAHPVRRLPHQQQRPSPLRDRNLLQIEWWPLT